MSLPESSHLTSSSQSTPSQPPDSEQDSDTDWIIVPQDWWTLSYQDVSWFHRRQLHWSPEGIRFPLHPRPLFYQAHLFNDKHQAARLFRIPSTAEQLPLNTPDDVDLNPSLQGVRGAEEAVSIYERHVGICSSTAISTNETLFQDDLSEADLVTTRTHWDNLVSSLLGIDSPRSPLNVAIPIPSEHSPLKLWDLTKVDDPPFTDSSSLFRLSRRSSTHSHSHSIADLSFTDSDVSLDSELGPTTPRSERFRREKEAEKKTYADAVLLDDRGRRYHKSSPNHKDSQSDGLLVAPSPSKPLNAAALSFIPATSAPSHLDPSTPPRHPHLHNQPDDHFWPTSPDSDWEPDDERLSPSTYTSPTYEFHFPSLTSQPSPLASRTKASSRKALGEHRHNDESDANTKEEKESLASVGGSRLGARSLPPKLRKDDQGFYTEVVGSPRAMSFSGPPSTATSTTKGYGSVRASTPRKISLPSSTSSVLPAFLGVEDSNPSDVGRGGTAGNGASTTGGGTGGGRMRYTSKTREIVDRLRSTGNSNIVTSGSSESPSGVISTKRGRKMDVSALRLPLQVEEHVQSTPTPSRETGGSSALDESSRERSKEKGESDLKERLEAIDGWISSLEEQALRDGWVPVPSFPTSGNGELDNSSYGKAQQRAKRIKQHAQVQQKRSAWSNAKNGGGPSTSSSAKSVSSAAASASPLSSASSSSTTTTFPSPASSMTSFGGNNGGVVTGGVPCSSPQGQQIPLLLSHTSQVQQSLFPPHQTQTRIPPSLPMYPTTHPTTTFNPSAYPNMSIPPPSVLPPSQAQAYMQMQVQMQMQAQVQWEVQARLGMGVVPTGPHSVPSIVSRFPGQGQVGYGVYSGGVMRNVF